MPRLQILAGPSPDALEPIQVNNPQSPYKLKTPVFEGEISVYVKDMIDQKGRPSTCDEYFNDHARNEESGRTWSIQAKGRYLKEGLTAADVVFGNIFDRALPLPTGSSLAMKFIEMKDPTLEHDLYASRPWLLSPLFSTVQYLSYTDTNVPANEPLPAFPPTACIAENSSSIAPPPTNGNGKSNPDAAAVARRTHFANPAERQKVPLGPSHIVQTDFCHGYLSFGGDPSDGGGKGNLGLSLPKIHFDLMKYFDGRPLWYVCCEKGKDGKGPGPMIWCVAFQILLDDDDTGLGEDNSGEID